MIDPYYEQMMSQQNRSLPTQYNSLQQGCTGASNIQHMRHVDYAAEPKESINPLLLLEDV